MNDWQADFSAAPIEASFANAGELRVHTMPVNGGRNAVMNEPGPNSNSKTMRGVIAAVAMVGVAGLIGLFNEGLDYPPWFLGVLLGLTAINLANWVFESRASAPQARCRRCGAMRVAHDGSVCVCGAGEVRMPWLNRLALGLVVVFLGTIGISSLWAALTDSSLKSHVKGIGLGVVMITLAVATVFEIMGCHVISRLHRSLGRLFPYEFERDIRGLKLQRHLAIRVILLVLSVVVLTASAMYLMRHPWSAQNANWLPRLRSLAISGPQPSFSPCPNQLI